jgi:hypothetical protein
LPRGHTDTRLYQGKIAISAYIRHAIIHVQVPSQGAMRLQGLEMHHHGMQQLGASCSSLQARCAKAKLSSLGSENADVVRDTVFRTLVPHTCIQTDKFDSKEDLCHYVLQQVLLNKPLLPKKGMYQKLDICETIAFCEKNFQYNAASTKV